MFQVGSTMTDSAPPSCAELVPVTLNPDNLSSQKEMFQQQFQDPVLMLRRPISR